MSPDRERGKKTGKKEKTDDYCGHYVLASSQPLERRLLERHTLVPKRGKKEKKREKNVVFRASNGVASRLPERRPTGTLRARAKSVNLAVHIFVLLTGCKIIKCQNL